MESNHEQKEIKFYTAGAVEVGKGTIIAISSNRTKQYHKKKRVYPRM